MIPSGSMIPAILPGDYVIASKISYDPRIINSNKLVSSGEAKKNDILVFDYPQYEYLIDSVTLIYGAHLMKRCYGIPGDSVQIRRNGADKVDLNTSYNNFFPYDTSLHWSSDYYGPLYIPKKGDTILLTQKNVKHYRDVLMYENTGITIRNDSLFSNGIHTSLYCFKYNYYFMLGDNYYQSKDSRFWGLLPETHIIGKAVLVLFSLDPNKPWYRKFRWNRFLKRIR